MMKLTEEYTLEDMFQQTSLASCAAMLEVFGQKVTAMGRWEEVREAMDCFWSGLTAHSYLSDMTDLKNEGRMTVCPPEKSAVTYLDAALSPDKMVPKALVEYGGRLRDRVRTSGVDVGYEGNVELFRKVMEYLDQRFGYSSLVLKGMTGLAIFPYDQQAVGGSEIIYHGANPCLVFFRQRVIPNITGPVYPMAPVFTYRLAELLVDRLCSQPGGWKIPQEAAPLLTSKAGYCRYDTPKGRLIDAVRLGFDHEIPYRWEELEFCTQKYPELYQFGADVLKIALKMLEG